jgi:hypothetical protein
VTLIYEKIKTDYPKSLANTLARLKESQWRKLRAEVRWKYVHWDLVPPPLLRHHISVLWEDSIQWQILCKQVNLIRGSKQSRKRREQQTKEAERERRHRRDYMRVYMANYRKHPKRRGST